MNQPNLGQSVRDFLTLNPLFRRDYNSLYKGIQDFLPPPDHPNYPKATNGLFDLVSATVPAHGYLLGQKIFLWPTCN